MKYYLRGLLYNKEVAALQKSLSSCPTFVPWDVEIRPCTSGSSNECQQRASRSTELPFPPSITPISRSSFANYRALAKSFSSVVFLVLLSRQFGLTGRKATWRSEFPLVTIYFVHQFFFVKSVVPFSGMKLTYQLCSIPRTLCICTISPSNEWTFIFRMPSVMIREIEEKNDKKKYQNIGYLRKIF